MTLKNPKKMPEQKFKNYIVQALIFCFHSFPNTGGMAVSRPTLRPETIVQSKSIPGFQARSKYQYFLYFRY